MVWYVIETANIMEFLLGETVFKSEGHWINSSRTQAWKGSALDQQLHQLAELHCGNVVRKFHCLLELRSITSLQYEQSESTDYSRYPVLESHSGTRNCGIGVHAHLALGDTILATTTSSLKWCN
jgi:hypothetical protein